MTCVAPGASVPYCDRFVVPTNSDALVASESSQNVLWVRFDHLPTLAKRQWCRPSLASGGEDQEQAFEDVNNETFFREPNSEPHPKTGAKRKRSPKSKQMLWQPLSPPMDENDWLAIMDEPGQTFDEFVEFITTQTGRFNSNHFGGAETPNNQTTVSGLCPIIQK